MEALSGKAVLLVTHQVDFLPAFHRCLVSPLQGCCASFLAFAIFLLKWVLEYDKGFNNSWLIHLNSWFLFSLLQLLLKENFSC
mgnify:CR=1 FL=1